MPIVTKTFITIQFDGNNLEQIQTELGLTDDDIWYVFNPVDKDERALLFKLYYYIFPGDWLMKDGNKIRSTNNEKYQKWIS